MNDFTKEELLKMYDKQTVKYIIDKKLTSFKNYCTCGGYIKYPIDHQYWCPQEKEVVNSNE